MNRIYTSFIEHKIWKVENSKQIEITFVVNKGVISLLVTHNKYTITKVNTFQNIGTYFNHLCSNEIWYKLLMSKNKNVMISVNINKILLFIRKKSWSKYSFFRASVRTIHKNNHFVCTSSSCCSVHTSISEFKRAKFSVVFWHGLFWNSFLIHWSSLSVSSANN